MQFFLLQLRLFENIQYSYRCIIPFTIKISPQMMEHYFDKTVVPFDKLNETFRSSDIHVLLFSLRQ